MLTEFNLCALAFKCLLDLLCGEKHAIFASICPSPPPPRVVAPGSSKVMGPHSLMNWGAHCDDYPTPYFTVAAAIGMVYTLGMLYIPPYSTML